MTGLTSASPSERPWMVRHSCRRGHGRFTIYAADSAAAEAVARSLLAPDEALWSVTPIVYLTTKEAA